tara:strand:- start:4136 stop:4273 length:138 start_codon:yes stop_codon:yes gene_type:complete
MALSRIKPAFGSQYEPNNKSYSAQKPEAWLIFLVLAPFSLTIKLL